MSSLLLRLVPDRDFAKHMLLDEGERVKDVVRHHWIVFVRPYLVVVAGVALIVSFPFWSVRVAGVAVFVGLGIAAVGMYRAAVQHLDLFIITNYRVVRVRGVFDVNIATMPMTRILDITVERPLLGRVLNYGHFIFENAAQKQGLRTIRYVPDAYERDRTLQLELVRAGLRTNTQSGR